MLTKHLLTIAGNPFQIKSPTLICIRVGFFDMYNKSRILSDYLEWRLNVRLILSDSYLTVGDVFYYSKLFKIAGITNFIF